MANDTLVPEQTIREEDFTVLFPRNYAQYMAATIVDRAIPDARDGLKPVQRRILYCMYINGYRSNKPTIKSAKIVGQVTGDFHPHGDAAIYQTMARMAQDFTLRYPLIDGQGNMGSIDNDPPAAARYTEARLTEVAEVLLKDVDQHTVSLVPTYLQDPRIVEPLYLTGHLPPVVNPISGVAVAMATNVPPHNLTEVINAATALLDKPDMSTKELMKYIQGPDLPTGGSILGEDGIREYLETGKGRFTMRGTVRLEDSPRGQALVITEIPFTTKDKIKESIAKATNERKLEGVSDLRDESDEDHGLRIVLTLRKDANAAQTLNSLYAHTDLQQNYNVQMVFLFGEQGRTAVEPRQVGMVELLTYWNAHQLDVLTKRLEYELQKAKDRLHIVQGLIIGAANAQQIVKIFQQAANRQVAKEEIKKKYKLSEIQAETIAQMTLSQVTKLDAGRYQEERKSLEARIAELEAILGDQAKLVALLKSEYKAVKEKYGDPRRTVIDRDGQVEVTVVQNIIEEKGLSIQLSPDGYLRVIPDGKRRGRKDYPVLASFTANTTDYVIFVSNQGKIYALRANRLPEAGGKGESIRKLLGLDPQERVVGALAVDGFHQDTHLVQFTKLGRVKKSALYEYRSADTSGLSDLNLQPDDEVCSILIAEPGGHYLVLTSNGKALRFADDALRASGRIGQGVQAINLAKGAEVIAAFAVAEKDSRYLVTAASTGFGKKTRLDEYPTKGRATGGVQAIGLGTADILAAAEIVEGNGELLIWTETEEPLRVPAKDIPTTARDRKGSLLPGLTKGDKPAGIARV
ncbi:MAG: DNA gyrase/topoisomerase IV subunit A [Chloroflexota bacterium]